jgi:uncharacterized protein with HEPN domain
MLDNARATESFVRDMSYEQYLCDRKTRFAVERTVQIIGEAARRVSSSFKADHPEIPWPQIVSQRNVLVHEYGDLKHERLWTVATVQVAALIPLLEAVMPPLPPESID